MQQDCKKLFAKLRPLDPPARLFDGIMSQIAGERKLRVTRNRLILFSVALIGSLAAIIPAFKLMQTDFNESGFRQFFSLLFSDFGVVLAYWQSFAWTLLESLPIVGLAALLAAIFTFLLSLKFFIRDIQTWLKPKQISNHFNH